MGRTGRICTGADAGRRLRAGRAIQSARKLGGGGVGTDGGTEYRRRRRDARITARPCDSVPERTRPERSPRWHSAAPCCSPISGSALPSRCSCRRWRGWRRRPTCRRCARSHCRRGSRIGQAAAEPLCGGLRIWRHAGRSTDCWRPTAFPRPRSRWPQGCSASVAMTCRWRCWRRAASPLPPCWWRWRSATSRPPVNRSRRTPRSSRRHCRSPRWRCLRAQRCGSRRDCNGRCCNGAGGSRERWRLPAGTLLLVANPAVTGDPVGQWPLLDWLLPAYACLRALALVALRHPGNRDARRAATGAGLLRTAGRVSSWITLEIRHLFHLDAIGFRHGAGGGCRTLGVVCRMAGVRCRVDGGRYPHRQSATAAGSAWRDRAGGREGVPGRYGRAGRTVAGAVVPRSRSGADRTRRGVPEVCGPRAAPELH